MKKRIFSLCLVLLLVLAVAGCGKKTAETVVPMSEQYEKTDSSEEITSEEDTTDAKGSKKKWEASGGLDVYESMMGDDEKSEGFKVTVEKNTIPATTSTKWEVSAKSPVQGGAEAEAAAMREKVLSSKNTKDYYTWSGKTYYISPDGDDKNDGLSPKTAVKTLNADAIYAMDTLKAGDALLFERGGVWRMSSSISARKGVIYGSYGTGEKPTLVGSSKNYADKELWTPSQKANIWKCTLSDTDIGLIVFNHGELVGYKRFNGLTTLENNGDYYYNNNDDTIYIYFDKGNPGKYFKDIEICYNKAAFGVGRDDVVIDNFRIKYYGRFGVSMSGNNNTKITNCEFGFIGGAVQSGTTRYGNAIQQWDSTDKQLVENNWIYQCYDTGITFQGSEDENTAYYKDISYINNLVEYCVLGIEIWHGDNGKANNVQMKNINVSGNIVRHSGYAWSAEQRPDKIGYAFCTRDRWFPNAQNYQIKNNIFDVSRRALIFWSFTGGPYGDVSISGNTFYQTTSQNGDAICYGTLRSATDQSSLAAAVASFDTSPAKVQWLTK